MGWWNATKTGGIAEGPSVGLWGDEPADIMGKAVNAIESAFEQEHGRSPTHDELRAGLEFSLPSD